MRAAVAAVCGLALLLAGCAVGRDGAPVGAFDPLRFFDGAERSRGTITTALVFRKEFTAGFSGAVEAGTLVLDERFHFPEGGRLQRWRLRPDGAGRCDGTVETEGKSGRLHPPAPVACRIGGAGVALDYDGYAPGGDRLLHFRHRMAMQADGTVVNRVRVGKFGLPLAGATVVFERVPATAK